MSAVASLGLSDARWLAWWTRYRRVRTIAAALGLHPDDVTARLRAAGASLKGRPPDRASTIVEATGTTVEGIPEGRQVQLLLFGDLL